MSPHETKLQYTKIVLGFVALVVFVLWGLRVVTLLEVIANK